MMEDGSDLDITEVKWIANCSKCGAVGEYKCEGDVYKRHMKRGGKKRSRACGLYKINPRMTWASEMLIEADLEDEEDDGSCCLYDGLFVIYRTNQSGDGRSHYMVGRISDYNFDAQCCLEEFAFIPEEGVLRTTQNYVFLYITQVVNMLTYTSGGTSACVDTVPVNSSEVHMLVKYLQYNISEIKCASKEGTSSSVEILEKPPSTVVDVIEISSDDEAEEEVQNDYRRSERIEPNDTQQIKHESEMCMLSDVEMARHSSSDLRSPASISPIKLPSDVPSHEKIANKLVEECLIESRANYSSGSPDIPDQGTIAPFDEQKPQCCSSGSESAPKTGESSSQTSSQSMSVKIKSLREESERVNSEYANLMQVIMQSGNIWMPRNSNTCVICEHTCPTKRGIRSHLRQKHNMLMQSDGSIIPLSTGEDSVAKLHSDEEVSLNDNAMGTAGSDNEANQEELVSNHTNTHTIGNIVPPTQSQLCVNGNTNEEGTLSNGNADGISHLDCATKRAALKTTQSSSKRPRQRSEVKQHQTSPCRYVEPSVPSRPRRKVEQGTSNSSSMHILLSGKYMDNHDKTASSVASKSKGTERSISYVYKTGVSSLGLPPVISKERRPGEVADKEYIGVFSNAKGTQYHAKLFTLDEKTVYEVPGLFDSNVEAARARDELAMRLFGPDFPLGFNFVVNCDYRMHYGAHVRDNVPNPSGILIDREATAAEHAAKLKENSERIEEQKNTRRDATKGNWRSDPEQNPCYEWDREAKDMLSAIRASRK